MPWIENVSLEDIEQGLHHAAGARSMLIRICDPGDQPLPAPKYVFQETHVFEFLDVDETGLTNLGTGEVTDMTHHAITDQQAAMIVELLQRALHCRINVVVHCLAGVYRSGAVAEVGVQMGFADCEGFRIPNKLVKTKLLQAWRLLR